MDMSQYLEIFLEEAREHLQKLNDSLLSLESDPDGTGTLDEIFRSAHTLKGMSATMGFNHVAELTHEMENVLHKLRSGEASLNSYITDLLFKAVDLLDNAIADIANGNEDGFSVDAIVYSLKGVLKGDYNGREAVASKLESDNLGEAKGVCFNEYEKHLILEAAEQGYHTYHIILHISPKCVMKSARAFMIFKVLEKMGEIVQCVPSVQDIEEEKFDTSFSVVLVTKEETDSIRRKLQSITEVEEPDIEMVSIANRSNCQGVECQQSKECKEEQNSVDEAMDTNEVSKVTPCEKVRQSASPLTKQKVRASQSVRVDINRLDNLINLVGELVINKTRLVQIGRGLQNSELSETLEQMDRISVDLQNVVMKVRMVPVDMVFNRFPRMVRDLAKELGKEIDLIIDGKETELDRTVIDEIGDPLVHLLRNSVDHGVEMPDARGENGKSPVGIIKLVARHEGSNVIIEVTDDGRGIDIEVVKRKALERQLVTQEELSTMDDSSILMFIFQAGLSTAEKVTDVSGRGVGLDVVKNKIEALSGSIQIESVPGQGTTFKIQLPLTLAIIQALLVRLESEIYAIPLSFIAETTSVLPNQLNRVQDQEVILLRGDVLPLIRLHRVFSVPECGIEKEEEINIVVVRKGEKRVGLIVDSLLGQQEIVIKSLGNLLGGVPTIAGATILGNGQVSLIIDVASLF